VPHDDLNRAEHGLQPVGHGQPMPNYTCSRLDDTDPEHDERPPNGCVGVAVDDAQLDPTADRPGHRGLGHEPADTERNPGQEREPLVPRDPEQEPDRGAGVRDAGVGNGKVTHVTPG
jgi:hypothetical protein